MKTMFDNTVTIITPCFCAGLNQNHAEIRATSIRGEWRWWFRALGGNREEEAHVFGASSGSGKASKVIVRTLMQERGMAVKLSTRDPNAPLSYLLYFVHASSTPKGKRLEDEGMLPPETIFRLQVLAKSGLSDALYDKAEHALWVMLRFGAIGYRARRACGSISAEILGFDTFKEEVAKLVPFDVEVVWMTKNGTPYYLKNWRPVMEEFGTVLKELRKDGYSAGKFGDSLTPFGNAGNKKRGLDRQASGVRFRPVLLREGILPAIVYTEAGLDKQCRDPSFYLRGRHVGSGVLEGV